MRRALVLIGILGLLSFAGCTTPPVGTATLVSSRVINLSALPAAQNVVIPPGGDHFYPRVQTADCSRLAVYLDGVQIAATSGTVRFDVENYGASTAPRDGYALFHAASGVDQSGHVEWHSGDGIVGPQSALRVEGGSGGVTVGRASFYCNPW